MLKATMPTFVACEFAMGINIGSRFPSEKLGTGGNLPSLRMNNLIGSGADEELSSAVVERLGLANPDAVRRASLILVVRLVGWICSTAWRRSARFSVKPCSMRAVSEKLTTIAWSPLCSWLIRFTAWRLASARREGATSVALMLAELSIRNIDRPPTSWLLRQPGRSSETMKNDTISNCRYKKQALADALPGAVDVQIFQRLVPQKRAGNFQRLAAQLEEIERHNRRRHGQ